MQDRAAFTEKQFMYRGSNSCWQVKDSQSFGIIPMIATPRPDLSESTLVSQRPPCLNTPSGEERFKLGDDMTQRFHLIWPLLGLSLLLAVLSAVAALGLVREQRNAAADLRVDAARMRTAAELEECFTELIALIKDRVRTLNSVHRRAQTLLDESLQRNADQVTSEQLAKINHAFQSHLQEWNALPSGGVQIDEAVVPRFVERLEREMVRPSHVLEAACSQKLQYSADQHSQLLRRTTWGLVWVVGLGGIAGLVFGFGVSQGVSRSIRRLQVQVRDAAGKLDPSASEIVLTGDGNVVALHDEMDSLSERIERFVAMLQQRDREVLRAEHLAALGQLAAGVAHEVRNPLTSIKLLVQAELEQGTRGGMAAEDLRIIESEVQRMERSLQTFLDYARLTEPEQKCIDLETIVRNVMGLIRGRAARQRVEMVMHAPDHGVAVSADVNQMQQVVLNLAMNALDVMPHEGRLTFTTRLVDGNAELCVEDTGPGIAPDMLPRLFQPFATNKETGLGLGLVISRRIVEAHGGRVSVERSPTGGALFRVALPAYVDQLAGASA